MAFGTKLRTCAIALLSLGAISQVQALEIAGAYGNAEGCKLHKGGEIDNDSLLLVTASEITSYGTGCEIVQLLQAKGGTTAVAVGLCGFEGEDMLGTQNYVLRKTEATPSKLQVYNADGSLWAELSPCP